MQHPTEPQLKPMPSVSMSSNLILSMDPSGAYKEGKGKTGWCLVDGDTRQLIKAGYINAQDFESCYDYWKEHITLINHYQPTVLVLEDYLLYASKAQDQINSRFETSQLLGVIKFIARSKNIPFALQPASAVKQRWNNDILYHHSIIKPHGRGWKTTTGKRLNGHMLDAIRHGMHFATFGKESKYEVF